MDELDEPSRLATSERGGLLKGFDTFASFNLFVALVFHRLAKVERGGLFMGEIFSEVTVNLGF